MSIFGPSLEWGYYVYFLRRYNMLMKGGPTVPMLSQIVNKPMETIQFEAYISYFTDSVIRPFRLLFQLMGQVPHP